MKKSFDIDKWRADPASFIEETMIDPETNRPFELLEAEQTFLSHAFRLKENGKLLYSEQVYSAPKKSGKTAFAAMHTLITTLLFGGNYPEAYLLANDLDQSQGRVFEACRRIVEKSPLLRSHAKVTAKQIEFPFCGGSIQAIASDYAGAAGTNPVISVFDELWGYTTERSHRLWDEMTPPPTRKITCRLTVTYAGFEGESVLLENLYKRGLLLPEIGKDLRAGEGLLMFWSHVPIAPWQDQDWLDNSRATMRPNAYARMIENRFSTNLETFIDIDAWDACVDPDLRPEMVHHYLPIWVGIDASVKRDSTAIVATTWDTKKKNVRMICHKIVQPSQANHIDFERDIEDYVLKLCQRFSVKEVLYDPYQMQASAQRLLKARPKVPMTEYPQSVPNITAASQNLYELVKAKGLVAYPDDQIRLAVQRSVAIETPRGWKISKEKASHKIDVVVALGMAAHAAVQNAATSNYNSNYREWV